MVAVITLCTILNGQHIYLTTIAFVVIILINTSNILGIQNNNVLENVTKSLKFEHPCPEGWFFIQQSEKCYNVIRRNHLRRYQKRACNDRVLPNSLKSDLSIIKDAQDFGDICDKIREQSIQNTGAYNLHTDIFRDDHDIWRWIRTNKEVDPSVLNLISNDHKKQKWKYAYFHVDSSSCQLVAKETEEILSCYGLCEIWNVNNCTYNNGGCKEEEDHAMCVKVTPGVSVCKCRTGFDLRNGICADIDECKTFNPGCVNDTCKNTQGSFTCRAICGKGFEDKNYSCVDINECKAGTDDCVYSYECVNNQGSFSCVEGVFHSWSFFVIILAIVISLASCLILNRYQRKNIRLEHERKERLSARHTLRESKRSKTQSIQSLRHSHKMVEFLYEDIYDKEDDFIPRRIKSTAIDPIDFGTNVLTGNGMDRIEQSVARGSEKY